MNEWWGLQWNSLKPIGKPIGKPIRISVGRRCDSTASAINRDGGIVQPVRPVGPVGHAA